MEYLFAVLALVGFIVLTTTLSAFLRLLIPIIYVLLGFILGKESIILGIGGLIGNIINIYNTTNYIKTEGAMSHAPRMSKISSIGFIIAFSATIILKFGLEIDLEDMKYWYLLPLAFIAWFILKLSINSSIKNRTQSLDNFYESVAKYKIVSKYSDDPKWAIYLYFKNGEEGWNKTIRGSFCAKDPENDLTFVFISEEEALNYAQREFKNAEYISSKKRENENAS